MPCPIWGTPAEHVLQTIDYDIYDSPRTGGKYRITELGAAQAAELDVNQKKLLTTWLCEQHNAGIEIPQISSEALNAIKGRRPKVVTQRLISALCFLDSKIKVLGHSIDFGQADDKDTLECLAETESIDEEELFTLYKMLEDTGLVEGTFFMGGGMHVKPTAAGWQEIERLATRQTDSSQAFVAMWFNDATADAYTRGIEPALTVSGYKAMRIDAKEHNNKIDDEIVAEIRRSRFLVADFTCETGKVRGGVYYEAGFAQGLGLPVIWTCKKSSLGDLHFDTRQYAHIVWDTPEDLYEQLKNRIGATIGDGPLPKK